MMLFCLGTLERVMKDLEEVVEVMMTSKDVQHKSEARSNTTSTLPRPPEDQSAIKWSPRTYLDSIFDDPHMDGKIIS